MVPHWCRLGICAVGGGSGRARDLHGRGPEGSDGSAEATPALFRCASGLGLGVFFGMVKVLTLFSHTQAGVLQDCSRSAPGVLHSECNRSAPGVHQECARSAPGFRMTQLLNGCR